MSPQAFGNQAAQKFAQTCPLALPSPVSCPFGGICHSCPPRVQAKLKIGQPGDVYEQEADRVAEEILRQPELMAEGGPERLAPPQPLSLQRSCAPCDEELRRLPLEECEEPRCPEGEGEMALLPKGLPGQTQQVSPAVEAAISSSLAGGSPLPGALRNFYEPRFGQDFSGVRLHTDAQAAAAAQTVQARAFTLGRHIVLGAGEYAPETERGKKLLAHELTHVVQQSSRSQPPTPQTGLIKLRMAAPHLARWSVSGNTATVDQEGDTLWELAKSITRDGRDWPCIWPIEMRSPRAWESSYWLYLNMGDRFDISNLTATEGASATFTFAIADDDLRTVEEFYDGVNPANLHTEMGLVADFGGTPIKNLTICGHIFGTWVSGDNAAFSPDGLRPEEPEPTGAGAHNQDGPHRCWFTRNATVRIVGCNSETVARPFAEVFLRRGARALGTNQVVCFWHQTDPEDSRFASVEDPCSWPTTATRLYSADEVNRAPGLWVTIPGRL